MNREGRQGWMYKAILVFLISSNLLNPLNAYNIVKDTSYVDSLLRDAISATNLEDFDLVFNKFIKVIHEAESIADHRNQILGNINLGLLYLGYNADEEALNYLLTSLDLTDKFEFEELLNTIYNNIGVIYSSNGDFQRAEEYFLKALNLSQQRKEQKKIGINLVNLGELKSEEGELEQATVYYQQSLELFQAIKDTINISMVLNNIGNVFYQRNNYLEAKKYFHNALVLLEGNHSKFYLPLFQLHYAKSFYQLEQYDTALVYFHSSLDSFLLIKNTDQVIKSYNWLAKTYEIIGDKELALQYYQECLKWKDISLNEKSQKWLSEIEMKYEFGQKTKEIEFLQHRAQQEQLIWTGSILALLIISSLLFFSLKTKNTNLKQKNIILEKEQEVSNLEITQNQLLQEQLKQKLEMKNRALASKALHLLNKNEILTSITTVLDQINVQHESSNAHLVRNAKRTITRNINLDEQWEDFKIHFEEVHTGFFKQLNENYPSLSPTDRRLCAYLLINLGNKEIAQISNISPGSVRKRKQRLREKLNLSKDQDIRVLLSEYELT